MPLPESPAEVIRKLVALERIPMFSDLPTIALTTLAQVAREVPVKAGEVLAGRDGCVLFAPDGVERSGPSRSVVDEHAPALGAKLAGVGSRLAGHARADGVILEVSLPDLAAALEDDFSLFLAMSAAVARDAVEAELAELVRSDGADREPDRVAGTAHDRISHVLQLQTALPFAHTHVASLFQLARHTAEVRAQDGVELWRVGDRADLVLLPIRGALGVREAGGDARPIARGSTLALAAALTRQERRFTAVACGEFAGLTLPLELFLDVLEDEPELASAVLRALARLAVGED